AAAPPPNPPAGTPATVLDDQEVSTILGKSVRSSADEDMGRIVDIIVSRDGQVHAAIIDFGGVLRIGTRKIAVDWRALNFAPAGKPGSIPLALTRNQVRLAPEYKRGEPVVVVGAAGAERAMPSSEVAAPERESCPARRHPAIPVTLSDAGSKTTNPPQSGRCPLSHRSPPRAAAGAASIGSRSASPTCRRDLGRSSPSISRRKDGRRSTSASFSPPAVLPDWRCKCPAGPSSMPRGRNAASPRWR